MLLSSDFSSRSVLGFTWSEETTSGELAVTPTIFDSKLVEEQIEVDFPSCYE